MLISPAVAMRRLIIALSTVCAVFLCAALYFRFALRPVPPLSSVREEPPKTYWPLFHTLSSAQKGHILDGDFTIERNVESLPNSLKSAFSGLAGEHDFKMANPGNKYQATDVVVEPGLPFRRLVFAGIATDKYLLHYEEGGIGHIYQIAVFGVDSEGKVKFLWGGPGPRAANDLEQLRTMVAGGAFADDRAYYW